jgi:predicted RNase H-like HicB family nuclease
MKLCIHVMKTDDGRFTAVCSSLPGCVSTGQTRDQAVEKLHDAIEGYIAAIGNCPEKKPIQVMEIAG